MDTKIFPQIGNLVHYCIDNMSDFVADDELNILALEVMITLAAS